MSTSLFFELESGNIVESTKNASLHIAGGNLHFWHGPFMFSIGMGEFNIKCFSEFMNHLHEDVESIAGMKFSYEKDPDGESGLFCIDEIDMRFMFSVNPIHVNKLANFLYKNSKC
jgi:hypothetical protein